MTTDERARHIAHLCERVLAGEMTFEEANREAERFLVDAAAHRAALRDAQGGCCVHPADKCPCLCHSRYWPEGRKPGDHRARAALRDEPRSNEENER